MLLSSVFSSTPYVGASSMSLHVGNSISKMSPLVEMGAHFAAVKTAWGLPCDVGFWTFGACRLPAVRLFTKSLSALEALPLSLTGPSASRHLPCAFQLLQQRESPCLLSHHLLRPCYPAPRFCAPRREGLPLSGEDVISICSLQICFPSLRLGVAHLLKLRQAPEPKSCYSLCPFFARKQA